MTPGRMERMQADDAIFWGRLMGMPALEAEQELVLRREEVTLQTLMLRNEHARAKVDPKRKRELPELAAALRDCDGQLALIGERIKYLRKIDDAIRWRDAVREVLGAEALEACIIWRAQRYADIDNRRRDWAAK